MYNYYNHEKKLAELKQKIKDNEDEEKLKIKKHGNINYNEF